MSESEEMQTVSSDEKKNCDKSPDKDPFKFFEVHPDDPPCVINNKLRMQTEMQELEKAKIELSVWDPSLYSDSLDNNSGGEAKIQKMVEKKEYLSNLNEEGKYIGKKIKAVRRKRFALTERIRVLREIQSYYKVKHPNVMEVEKIFFQFFHDHHINMYVVMPWEEHTLISWLLNKRNSSSLYHRYFDGEDSTIERSFGEVRGVLREDRKSVV